MSTASCKRLCRLHKYLHTLNTRKSVDQYATRPIQSIYNIQKCTFATKLRAVQPTEPEPSNVNLTPTSDPDNPFTLTDAQLAKLRVKMKDRTYDEPGIEYRRQQYDYLYSTKPTTTQHNTDDINTFIHTPTEILQSLPKSIQQHVDEQFRFAGQYILLRDVMYRAVQHLHTYKPNNTYLQRRISITGERGVGKSVALFYMCQVARELGWIVIGTDAAEFAWERKGFIQQNKTNPNIFDQATYTSVWFTELCKNEKDRLQQIHLPKDLPKFNWHGSPVDGEERKTSIVTNPSTLYDLAYLASQDIQQSADILYTFIQILNQQSTVPVLVAIDSINLWDQKSAFIHPTHHTNIPPRQLALIHVLQQFTTKPPKHGVTVMANTAVATLKYCRDYLEYTTEYVVQHYNYNEMNSIVPHYCVSRYMYSEPTYELVSKMKGLSGNVGRELWHVAGMM